MIENSSSQEEKNISIAFMCTWMELSEDEFILQKLYT